MAPKRPSPTSKPRWAQRTTQTHLPKHTKLSDADIQWLKTEMRKKYRWDSDPRLFQVDGVRAQLEGEDIIIQAPTGAGKTAIAAGPHLWPASAGKTTLMVCPLLALEEEMERTFANDFGLKAKAVNSVGGKLSPELVKELLAGTYQIVLISPEMLQSPAFVSRVLRRPAFARRILSMVVDEAHCVSHWGADFRKKYASLGTVRAYLPRGTPVVAITATLTARVRRDLHRVLHFTRGDSRFTNMGNDRPNVTIIVRAMEHPQHTYADLDFLIPSHITHPSDIPKSYIYVEDIKVGNEIIDHLNDLLALQAPTFADHGLIRPYNATLPMEYRTEAMAAFRVVPPHPGPAPYEVQQDQYVRILVCTDAAGMGCNVKDIARVVQWKLPKTLSNFVQRGGRAARGPNLTGLAILLVERSIYSLDLRPSTTGTSTQSSSATPLPTSGTKKRGKSRARAAGSLPKGYAQRHGIDRGSSSGLQDAVPVQPLDEIPHISEDAEDEGLRAMVQTNTCRRKLWAKVFDNPFTPNPAPGVPCCDICDPSVFNLARPGRPPTSVRSQAKVRAKGVPDYAAFNMLDEWRETVFSRDLANTPLDPTALLDDDTISHLVSVGDVTAAHVAAILSETWIWWKKYGIELTTFLCSLHIDYKPIKKKTSSKASAPKTVAPLAKTHPAPVPPVFPGTQPTKRPLDLDSSTLYPSIPYISPSEPSSSTSSKRLRIEPPALVSDTPLQAPTYIPSHPGFEFTQQHISMPSTAVYADAHGGYGSWNPGTPQCHSAHTTELEAPAAWQQLHVTATSHTYHALSESPEIPDTTYPPSGVLRQPDLWPVTDSLWAATSSGAAAAPQQPSSITYLHEGWTPSQIPAYHSWPSQQPDTIQEHHSLPDLSPAVAQPTAAQLPATTGSGSYYTFADEYQAQNAWQGQYEYP